MARIPTPEELGYVQPTATAQVSTADTSGLAAGIASMGASLSETADRWKQQANLVDVSRAEAEKTRRMLDSQNTFQQRPDYQSFRTEAPKVSQDAVQAGAALIRDPRKREQWAAHSAVDAVRNEDHIIDLGIKKEKDATTAAYSDSLDQMRRIYTDPNTPDDVRERTLRDMRATIDGAEKTGLVSASAALEQRKSVLDGGQAQYLENLAKQGKELPALGVERTTATGAPRFRHDVDTAIVNAAKATGVDENALRMYAKIESGGDPGNTTGQYKGLFQLSDGEFSKHGSGDIFNATDNAMAAANKLKAEAGAFKAKTGRDPTAADLYLIHQQGEAGYAAHLANPNATAWQNMLSTGEGQQKGEKWAKAAIWGNIPDQMKAKFGSVDNVTSDAFVKMWSDRVNSGKFGDAPVVDPRFANLPYDVRASAVSTYDTVIKQREAQLKAENAFVQNQTKERYGLAIQMDDPGVTKEKILADPRIDAGDKTHLLKAYEEREKYSGMANSILSAMANGEKPALNPLDPEVHKGMDRAYDILNKASGPGNELNNVDMLHRTTGVVPPKAVSQLRGAMVGTDTTAAANAMQVSNNLMMRNPNVFKGVAGGDDLSRKAAMFAHRVEDLGYNATDAAKMVQADDDIVARSKVKISDDEAKSFTDSIKKTSLLDQGVGKLFDKSWWPGNPQVGQTDAIKTAMLNDFSELALDYYKKGYSQDDSKAAAAQQLRGIWGVTKLQGSALNGVVMKYPPELHYPAAMDSTGTPGHEYIREQAVSFVKEATGKDVDKANVIMMPIPTQTAAAWGNRSPVPYQIMYGAKDKDTGQMVYDIISGKPFTADPNKANNAIISKADATNVSARGQIMTNQAKWAEQDAANRAPPEPISAGDVKGARLTDAQRQAQADATNEANAADFATRSQMVEDHKGADMSAAGLQARTDRAKAADAEAAAAVQKQLADDAAARDARIKGRSRGTTK